MAKLSTTISLMTTSAKSRTKKLIEKAKRTLRRADKVLRSTSPRGQVEPPPEPNLMQQPSNQPQHKGQPSDHPQDEERAPRARAPEPDAPEEEIVGIFSGWDKECAETKETREERQKRRQAKRPKQWERERAGIVVRQWEKDQALAAQGVRVRDFEMESLEREAREKQVAQRIEGERPVVPQSFSEP